MSNTLRLIYPQWQGGVISPLVPELTPADANLGYVLGSQLLDFLAPKNAEHKTAVVPVSTANPEDRRATGGISNWPRSSTAKTQIALSPWVVSAACL